MKTFPLKSGMRLGIPSKSSNTEEEIKGIQIGKGVVKLSKLQIS
jgi:hypothetical protein